MKKNTKIIIFGAASVAIFSVALFLGLFLGLRTKSFNENIHALMKNVQMVNENFIGFSLNGASKKIADKNYQAAVFNADSAEESAYENDSDINGLFAINENLEAEEVRFKKLFNSKEITNEDINRYGAVTQFFVMNNLLFMKITANEYLDSSEVEEDDYFSLTHYSSVAFAIDLDSKNIYSLTDLGLDLDSLSYGYSSMSFSFSLCHGLLFINPGIVNVPHATYVIRSQDSKLELKKVADTVGGEYLQDKYKNIYLIDNENKFLHPDANEYDLNYIDILTCDNTNYAYFLSTDKQIFRALKSSCHIDSKSENYSYVESLQADKTWQQESSSSNKILRNQLAYSTSSQGGEWMLKEGKIVRIASNLPGQAYCYNVDGKLIAHISNDEEEVVLYMGDENRFLSNSEYIDFYHGYDDYEKIVDYTRSNRQFCKFNIQVTGLGHILTVFESDNSSKRYKISVRDGNIELSEIKPIYNGFELVNEIVFLS